MANQGPVFGLSLDCKIKTARKFDIKQAREVLHWIEDVLGRQINRDIEGLWSERDVAAVLKDGVVLCELMNAIQPGAIRRINRGKSAFKQMENIEIFTKACVDYGLQQLDVFQITDLFEVKAVYTVFTCLHALGSLAQKNGYKGPKYGIAISDKKERHFSSEQIARGKAIIPMQAGTNVMPSQAGMSPYGFSRQIVPTDSESTIISPHSSNVISLQYGSTSVASQRGMTPYGLGRQITLSSVSDEQNDQSELDRSSSENIVDDTEPHKYLPPQVEDLSENTVHDESSHVELELSITEPEDNPEISEVTAGLDEEKVAQNFDDLALQEVTPENIEHSNTKTKDDHQDVLENNYEDTNNTLSNGSSVDGNCDTNATIDNCMKTGSDENNFKVAVDNDGAVTLTVKVNGL